MESFSLSPAANEWMRLNIMCEEIRRAHVWLSHTGVRSQGICMRPDSRYHGTCCSIPEKRRRIIRLEIGEWVSVFDAG